jgi:arylsulfatase A-like enzyme
LRAGSVWRSGASSVDLMPTILDAAGIKPVMGAYGNEFRPLIHGRSLLAAAEQGLDEWDRPIMIQNLPQRAIDGAFYEERALRTGQHKIILRKFGSRPAFRPGELYDMRADPAEANNLYNASGQRGVVQRMAGLVKSWGEQHDDKLSVELGESAETN